MMGYVARVDRTAGTVDVYLEDGTSRTDVPYVDLPPPPLSRVLLVGDYAVSIGRRRIFHDDFVQSAGVVGLAPVAGDHWWAFTAGGAALVAAEPNVGQGVVSLGAAGGAATRVARLQRAETIEVPDDGIVALSGRIRLSSNIVGTTRLNSIGFVNSVNALKVEATGSVWRLLLDIGGILIVNEVNGEEVTNSEWYDLDLVMNRYFQAAWVNGNGPAYRATGDLEDSLVPLNQVGPAIEAAYTSSAGLTTTRCDWISVDVADNALSPAAFPEELLRAA